jgi:hypothetical protein
MCLILPWIGYALGKKNQAIHLFEMGKGLQILIAELSAETVNDDRKDYDNP